MISKAEERYNKEGLTIPNEWNVKNICRIFLTEEILKKYLTEWLYKNLTEQQSRQPKPLITFTTQKNMNKSPSVNKTELIKSLIEYYQVEGYNMVLRDDETEVFLTLSKKMEHKASIHLVNIDYLPTNDDLRRANQYFTLNEILPEGIQYLPIAELNNLGFPDIFAFTTVEKALFTHSDITDIQIHESNSTPQQIFIALLLTKEAQEKLNQIVENHEQQHLVLAINQLIYFSSPIYKDFKYRLFFPSDTTWEFTNQLIQMIKTN